MKTFQRILAIALALIMSLSVLGTVAFAAETIDTGATGSITIHKYATDQEGANGDGSELTEDAAPDADGLEGVTFTIYKVMDASDLVAYYGNTADTKYVSNFVTDGNINSGYTVAGTAKTDASGEATVNLGVGMYVAIETGFPASVTAPAEPFLFAIPMTNPANESEWMYDVHVYPKNSTSVGSVKLIKYGEENAFLNATFDLFKIDGASETKVGTYNTETNGSVTISSLAHGDYKLVEIATATNYIVNATPIYFTVNQDNTVTYDATQTTHQKVTAANDGTAVLTLTITNEKPDVTKTTTVTNAAVDQNVDFTVTVEVPTNITALNKFELKDAPTNLEVDVNTVKVYDNTTEVTGIGSAVAEGNGFILTFTPASMSAYAGKTLTIKYTAKVLASAATAGSASNEVTLTYQDSVNTQTAEATAALKNYSFGITKYKDSVADANKAAGVEFELYSDADLSNKVTVSGDAGNYVVSTTGTTTLVTGNDGALNVSGLAAGTYYLKETKAPEGYNLLKDPIEITLNETTSTFSQNVINKAGFTLPETGGIGTLMFIIIGGVLIAGGICLITVPSKKRAR